MKGPLEAADGAGCGGRRALCRRQCAAAYRAFSHWTEDIDFVGDAIGYDGPVAALLLDGKGGLAGASRRFERPSAPAGTFRISMQGFLWTDVAIQVVDRKVVWHRLQGLLNPLEEGAHLDLFVYATSKDNDGPAVFPDATNPFADPKWRPASYVRWCGAHGPLYRGQAGEIPLGGRGVSPAMGWPALRCRNYGWSSTIPPMTSTCRAIYRNQAGCDEFLLRLLSLYASFNQDD